MSDEEVPTDSSAIKTCPRCAEQVKAAALMCRFCGYEFAEPPASPASQVSWTPPPPSPPPPQSPPQQAAIAATQVIAPPVLSPVNWNTCQACSRPLGIGRACQFCQQIVGAEHGVRLAGIGQRFGAALLDGVILLGILSLGGYAATRSGSPPGTYNYTPLWVILMGYALTGTALMACGQSLGKSLLGIRAATLDGRRASWGRTWLRQGLAKPLLNLITLSFATVWALWDRDRQTLYDKMASTLVVDDRALSRKLESPGAKVLAKVFAAGTALLFVVVWSLGPSSTLATGTAATPLSNANISQTAPAAQTPTPTPAPTHPYPVVLQAQQMIMPISEFPFAGYTVTTDTVAGYYGWRRDFSSTAGDYWWFEFYVYVYGSSTTAQSQLALAKCTDFTFTANNGDRLLSQQEVTAEVIADGAKACVHHFAGTTGDAVEYITVSRNVVLYVLDASRRTYISNTQAVSQAVALAKQQLGIIERVAPR